MIAHAEGVEGLAEDWVGVAAAFWAGGFGVDARAVVAAVDAEIGVDDADGAFEQEAAHESRGEQGDRESEECEGEPAGPLAELIEPGIDEVAGIARRRDGGEDVAGRGGRRKGAGDALKDRKTASVGLAPGGDGMLRLKPVIHT